MTRATATSRDLRAGCFTCHGDQAKWLGGNVQGIAARHHDLTGHATWCDVYMSVRYGTHTPDGRQIDIEDAIGASAAPEGQHP